MSNEPSRTPLLGRLVEHGFGGGRAEVMATFGLTALLDDDAVGPGFTAWLGKHGGVTLPDALTYVPEVPVPSGWVDIAGFEKDAWHVICEAKFGAELTAGQIESYLADAPGAKLLFLLVPENRRREAERLLASVSLGDLATLVMSWDDVCDALTACEADKCDVEQFRSLCRVAGGLDVAPLRPQDLKEGRQDRLADLRKLVDQASAVLHDHLSSGRLYPTQPADRQGFLSGYRYVCTEPNFCLAVGVRSHDVAPKGPFWLRWHRDTGGGRSVDSIASALDRAGLQPVWGSGHVWVHLEVTPDVGTRQVVRELVDQALRAHAATLEPR